MEGNTLCLWWYDKNWKASGRGYGCNVVVWVDFDKKIFKVFYTMANQGGTTATNVIEVLRKTELIDYAKLLKARGFALRFADNCENIKLG